MNADAIAELFAVLPGPPEKDREYVEDVEEEIRAYRELTAPFVRQRELDAYRVERLAVAAAAFAKAFDAIADSEWLLEQKVMMAARRGGMAPDAALAHAAVELADLRKVAAVTRRIGQSIRRSTKPLKPQAALKSLVFHLAIAYCETYGYRPSASVMGNFARAVARICAAEKIPAQRGGPPARPRQEWLQAVIDDPQIQAFRPPARSRKVKASN